ncbi:MAG: hypothetical protein U0821_20965 [Chloroflexota bacterium]
MAAVGRAPAPVAAEPLAGDQSGNGIQPILASGNPTCADLNPNWFGLKVIHATAARTYDGVFTLETRAYPAFPASPITNTALDPGSPSDPYNSITITKTVIDSPSAHPWGELFRWSSTLPIDAVIVKGGANSAYDSYVYIGESLGDFNLHPPLNSISTDYFGVSHLVFCYDYEVKVTKTADTSYTRTFDWEIKKSVDKSSLDLFTGDSATVNYAVDVTKNAGTDSNFKVTGVIKTLPLPLPATITGVTDTLPGATSPPSVGPCTVQPANTPITFPVTLATGQTLECPYSADLPDKTSRTNTASVTTTGAVGPGSGTASVSFGDPTKKVNDKISVSDAFFATGPQEFSATGSVSYPHTFVCDGDNGTKTNTATGILSGDGTTPGGTKTATADVAVKCYALKVEKTATTSWDRKYSWTINKTGPATWLVNKDVPVELAYDIVLGATFADTYAVSGSITIRNPAPVPATVNSVSDALGALSPTVTCPGTAPYTIAANNGALACTYSSTLPDKTGGTNVATATLQNSPSGTTNFSGNAGVSFGLSPTSETDEQIEVFDSFNGGAPVSQGTVKYTDLPKTLPYSNSITGLPCGNTTVPNKASFTTNDTKATGESTVSTVVTVQCQNANPNDPGCTLTIGYWKTHAGLGRQADVVTGRLPVQLGTVGGLKSFQVTTAAQAVSILEFHKFATPDGASNGLNKLSAQLLAAKLNLYGKNANLSSVGSTIIAADAMLAQYDTWTALTNQQKSQINQLASTLDNFNNGLFPGIPHCSEPATQVAPSSRTSTTTTTSTPLAPSPGGAPQTGGSRLPIAPAPSRR